MAELDVIISNNYIKLVYMHQGRRKLFITGQAKLNPEDYSIKCVGGR